MIDSATLEKLYTNTTPFGLLSNEDQKLFVKHAETGKWVFWTGVGWDTYEKGWIPCWSACWSDGIVYRLERPELIPPSIDWDAVDKKWNWLAVDKDERIRLYSSEPTKFQTTYLWMPGGSYKNISGVFSSFVRGNMPWNETLIARPKGEK